MARNHHPRRALAHHRKGNGRHHNGGHGSGGNGSGWRRILLAVLVLLGGLAMLGAVGVGVAGFVVYRSYADDLVPPQEMLINERWTPPRYYDRNGALLYEDIQQLEGLRNPVPLSDISPWLVKATIATEDASFYDNPGINLKGLLRAAYENFFPGGPGFLQGSGGSSITQQLVKNVYIPEEVRLERSDARVVIERKLKEVVIAMELTRAYSKDQILEWYLNQVPYGNLAYGAEMASQRYFGKPAKDLTLAEAAMLAGIPNAPAYYTPTIAENRERAKARQEEVLDLMVRHGFISEEEAEAAKAEELVYHEPSFQIEAPHFVFYVRDTFIKMCEKGLIRKQPGRSCEETLARGGLSITTSLDLTLQNQAQSIIEEWLAKTEEQFNSHNASLVAIRPATGEILTMVGSRDYFRTDIDGEVNVALTLQSPGSTVKPYTYLATFLRGWAPATLIWDLPHPECRSAVGPMQNWNGTFYGPMTVRSALGESRNLPACRALLAVGVDGFLEVAHKMGITDLRGADYGPAITIGGGDVKLLDHVYAFSVFANNGVMKGMPTVEDLPAGYRDLDPVSILEVVDAEGNVLYSYDIPEERQIVPAPFAYLITDILYKDANPWSRLQLAGGRPAASKTGTSEEFRDNMILGYTPDLSVGVWVGNTDNTPMANGTFSSANAGPIWQQFMNVAHQEIPVRSFTRPPGIVEVTVCVPSGLLPTENCPQTRRDLFVEGYAPTKRDDMWQKVKIDSRNGLRACDNIPPQFVEEKAFMVLPQDMQSWARSSGIEQPPTECSDLTRPPALITYPGSSEVISGTVFIRGRATSPNFVSYRLELGKGSSPSAWVPIGSEVRAAVEDGILGMFNPTSLRLESGTYSLRLVVNDRERGQFTATVTFEVRTSPGLTPPGGTSSGLPELRPPTPTPEAGNDGRFTPSIPRLRD